MSSTLSIPRVPAACRRPAWICLALFLLGGFARPAPAAETPRDTYDIPAGDAVAALRLFARQSGQELIYSGEGVEGVRTATVQGRFTPREALERLVAGTPLLVTEDRRTGALALSSATRPILVETKPTRGSAGSGPPLDSPNPSKDSSMQTPDPSPSPARPNHRARWYGFLLAAFASLQAQPADPGKPEDETITLSPFQVSAGKDTGYLAASTLAGTRLNTPLSDIGAPITVVTKDFLQDIGATDINQVFLYTVSTEGSGLGGNYSATVVGDEFPDVEASRRRPQTATRVRGLVAADLTRDYFLSTIPIEDYNIDRIDISRGPNAVLFGLGSPAGVANSTLIQPSYAKNSYRLALRYGDHDSYRSVVDINQVLAPRKLAARIAILNKETHWEQNPTFERDNRIFASIKANPIGDMTLKANVESGKIKARRPVVTNPQDRVVAWFLMGKPTHAGTDTNLAGPNWPPAPYGYFDIVTSAFQFASIFQQYVVVDEVNSQSPSMVGWMGQRGSDQTNPNTPGVRPTILRWVGPRFLGELGTDLRHAGVPLSIFNFRKQLLGGETGFTTNEFQAYNVALNQDFFNRKIGFEVAYSKEKYDDYFYEPFGDQRNRINVDVNTTLVDGRPNPNFGRPWVFVQGPNPKWNTTDNDSVRGTFYARWDAAEHFQAGFGRWLGRHTLTGLASTQQTDSFERQSIYAFANVDYDLNSANVLGGRNRVGTVIYIGPSIANLTSWDQAHLDFNLTTRLLQPGESSGPLVYWDRNSASFKTGEFPVVEAWSAALMQRQKIDSQAAILQSYWLKDALITTVGWRQDKARSYTSQLTPPTISGGQLNGSIDLAKVALNTVPITEAEGRIWTYSVVAKLPRSLNLPLGLDASIHYSQSENFQPNTGKISIIGGKLPSPSGETKEYGFTLSALENRASIKVNWYETSLLNAQNTEINNFLTGASLNNDFQTANFWYQGLANGVVGPDMPTQANIDRLINSIPKSVRDLVNYTVTTGTDGKPNGTIYSFPTNLIADNYDIVAKGLEIEGVINPTDHWRIAFNVAKQQTIKNHIAPFISDYIASRKPIWDELAYLQKQPLAPSPTPGSFGSETNRLVYPLLEQVKATEGAYSPDLRKWRANLVTNYTFKGDSKLNGFGFGGAWRWQSKAAVDYPLLHDANGVIRPDIAHPWYAPSETQIDLWVSYARLLYGKVRWRVQFNVTDVFADDNGVIPIAFQPWGEVSYVRAAPPRTWFMTSSFEF